jgi:hypothetical protein
MRTGRRQTLPQEGRLQCQLRQKAYIQYHVRRPCRHAFPNKPGMQTYSTRSDRHRHSHMYNTKLRVQAHIECQVRLEADIQYKVNRQADIQYQSIQAADIKYQDRDVGRHTVPTQTGRQTYSKKSDRQADIQYQVRQTGRHTFLSCTGRQINIIISQTGSWQKSGTKLETGRQTYNSNSNRQAEYCATFD